MSTKPTLVGIDSGVVKKRRYNPEQQRRWYLKNAEKKKAYVKERYRNNREDRIEWSKNYRKRKPEVTLASRLRCNYGLSVEKYEEMILSQDNKCAICGVGFNSEKRNTKPHVDHCHKTEKIRGILCHVCNMSIGHIERDGFLEKALFYINKNSI